MLVVYYSWSGNTRKIASTIKSLTGADIVEIVPETPYSTDYNETVKTAKRENDAEFLRLLKLLDTPDDIPMLAPVTIREIYTRILLSPVGKHVRQLCTRGTQSNQITRAVDWLKDNFRKPFKIDELAKYVHMSPTTFHRHFRKVTSVSPIQYQKNLRLHEARRIMISDNETVANAAYAVGYESPTQFSREYKRFFGNPPKRDVAV